MENNKGIVTACPGCQKKICDGCAIYKKLNTNKQTPVKFPKYFCPQKQEGLGISFDMGTTTLAGMLWNLETGTLLGVETAQNPQTRIGADIISRIQYAMESPKNLKKLQKLLVDSLDKMAVSLLADIKSERSVKKVIAVGNTAMCELLMGIKPEGIAEAPFEPDYSTEIQRIGADLGFAFLKKTDILVLPPVGGYVGSDALAVYHCMAAEADKESLHNRMLAVDIGTNGEILLKCGDKLFACSAAAGPALEGGAVSQGMRATQGAIEKVAVSGQFPMQDIVCKAIGDGAPVGICGSGLIGAMTCLIQTGVIDNTGYLRSQQEARAAGTSPKICRRIKEGRPDEKWAHSQENPCRGERCFLLTDVASPVYLTAGDIRQLQLSIAAIRAGMEVLLAKAGIEAADVSRFYLAGAFGSYIDIAAGKAVGLFSDISTDRILQAGNLASTGAAMALLSDVERKKMESEAKQFVHVKLAEEKNFEKLFLQYMNFPLHFYAGMI